MEFLVDFVLGSEMLGRLFPTVPLYLEEGPLMTDQQESQETYPSTDTVPVDTSTSDEIEG